MKSSVKANLIGAAVATVLGTSAAYALPPSATINFTFYAGGGSAQTNAAFWAATQLFTAGTIDSYSDNGAVDSGSYRVLTGTTAAALGAAGAAQIPAGSNVLFIYRFTGGSFTNGIQPEIGTGGTLAYPTIAAIQAAVATTNAYPLPTFSYTAANTNNQIPDWGVSDLEVAMFNFPDNLNAATPLTPSQVTAIQQDGIYDNVFAVAVTNALYAGTHPKTSFTKPEMVGILTHTLSDWSSLEADDGTALAAGPIVLLDRGSGSGSKASGNQYFLTYPGAKATSGAIDPGSVNSTTVNNYTSTTLVLPVTAFEDVKEGSSSTLVADLQAANAGGVRAIGILGAEFPPAGNQVGGVNQYSFAKIDGVGIDTGAVGDNINGPHGGTSATKYTNLVTGAYDYFYQNSLNTRSGFLTGTVTANVNWTNAIKTNLQSRTISGANASKAFPLAVPGVLLDPKIIGSQVAGVVTGSRVKHSTAPLQPVFPVTPTTVFGSDPL